MPVPTIGYGSTDKPFTEAFGRIIEVGWGKGVVIVELPENLAYLVSNDPFDDTFPVIGTYDVGVEIPKDDWKDYWAFEAQPPTAIFDPVTEGYLTRYYVTRSNLIAPIGFIEDYPDYELAFTGSTPSGNAPFGAALGYRLISFSGDAAGDVTSSYDELTDFNQPLFEFYSRPSDTTDEAIILYRYGIPLNFSAFLGYQIGTSGTGPNALVQIYNHDLSWTYDILVNCKKTSEVEIFQNSTVPFQAGHTPAPAVTLTAYSWRRFKVDPTTKRLVPFVPPPEGGGPPPDPPAPKWTHTVTLASYPPVLDSDVSRGKFNFRGFAAPGDPLP